MVNEPESSFADFFGGPASHKSRRLMGGSEASVSRRRDVLAGREVVLPRLF